MFKQIGAVSLFLSKGAGGGGELLQEKLARPGGPTRAVKKCWSRKGTKHAVIPFMGKRKETKKRGREKGEAALIRQGGGQVRRAEARGEESGWC